MQQMHLSARAYHRILDAGAPCGQSPTWAQATPSASPTSPRRSSTGPRSGCEVIVNILHEGADSCQ